MFNQEQIDKLLLLSSNGENCESDEKYFGPTMLTKFLAAKVLIERWGFLSSDFIIPMSKRNMVREGLMRNPYFIDGSHLVGQFKMKLHDIHYFLSKESFKNAELVEAFETIEKHLTRKDKSTQYVIQGNDTLDLIWGTYINYSSFMPDDKGLIIGSSDSDYHYQNHDYFINFSDSRKVATFPL